MSLALLYKDELKGFYKTKVMAVLWIGLPILSILMHYLQPDTEGISYTILVGLLIASISGTLASVMLAATIVSEKQRHVYDLYLIRPVKRSEIILSKYLAVYTCLSIAAIISILVGILIDLTVYPENFDSVMIWDVIWTQTWESLVISMAAMSIACAASILIGLMVNSVPLAAILAIYLGNQLSLISILPAIMIEGLDPQTFALMMGVSLTAIFLLISIIIINRKSI